MSEALLEGVALEERVTLAVVVTELESVRLGVAAALPVPDPVELDDAEIACEPLDDWEAVRDVLAVDVALGVPV